MKLSHSLHVEREEEYVSVTCPADGKTIASVPLGTAETVNDVVHVAHEAFDNWSKKTIKDRASYLIKFHGLIQKYRDELAALIVKEHGKTFGEAVAEINKGNETVEYAFSMPLIMPGKSLMVSRGVNCTEVRKALGVVVSIVPFNFPFMVPFWTVAIAIVTGNTIIIKPSEKVPLTMDRVLSIFKEAGIPDGVVNIVHGTAKST
jgi:malonate-semialdehyde dehydrogenase (acetylating)/methylmalonate-semialdehyde dehydrogenase